MIIKGVVRMEQTADMWQFPRKKDYVLKHKLTPNRIEQMQALRAVMYNDPNGLQKDWAEELGWSVQRVNRRKREIEELEKQGFVINELEPEVDWKISE